MERIDPGRVLRALAARQAVENRRWSRHLTPAERGAPAGVVLGLGEGLWLGLELDRAGGVVLPRRGVAPEISPAGQENPEDQPGVFPVVGQRFSRWFAQRIRR